jgi:hypothetical protein
MQLDKNKLHPWPVIESILAKSPTSEEYKTVVRRSGLSVDWSLNGNDNYSNSTRIRAYCPLVDSSFNALNEDDQLRVCAIISRELAKKEEVASQLNEALELVGWTLKDGILTTSNGNVIDVFFPKGAVHDAYVGIREILVAAKLSVDVIDPYSDSTLFQMLSASSASNLKIRILTAKTPPDFAIETKKFKQQNTGFDITIQTVADFHDRFIIRDSKDCFHLGHSIKDFGSKACMLTQIKDVPNCEALKAQFDKSWQSATPFSF